MLSRFFDLGAMRERRWHSLSSDVASLTTLILAPTIVLCAVLLRTLCLNQCEILSFHVPQDENPCLSGLWFCKLCTDVDLLVRI